MRGGENGGRIAIGLERIFDDVMSRNADRVDEELSREFRQVEARANGAAVEHERRFRIACVFDPRLEGLALRIEQATPEPNFACAVARPVIRRDKPRVMAVSVAEEGKIGREVERRE